MRKIPTLFQRDPEDMSKVATNVHPDCQWVLDGEGVATRKYDGTCFAKLEGDGWVARREVKPGKKPPPDFIAVSTDETTGKTVGWEPANQSPFAKMWREATYGKHHFPYGTYELCGPKINGNPEGYEKHALVPHSEAERYPAMNNPRGYDELRQVLVSLPWEGLVWHHPDGRMAKLKARDFTPPGGDQP